MAGPNIQVPAAISQMLDVQTDEQGRPIAINVKPEWAAFFSTLQQVNFVQTRSGTTAERPTSDTKGRYEGMPFMDTTLGKPVFLKYASSNVWVDGSGAVV